MARLFPSLSLFEKVLVANTAVILVEALAAWWITRHALESYHYLIDTSFLVAVALVGLLINTLLLRTAFRPLFGLLSTIQVIEAGCLDCRAPLAAHTSDVSQVAAALNAMLDRLEAQRHQTAGEILHAQELERRRLALELHDQSSQTLTALTLHAQVLEDLLAADAAPALLRKQVAQVNQLAGRTMSELRHVAEQLRPVILDDLGLEAALRWLADDVGQATPLRVLVQVSPEGEQSQRLAAEVETALFRIAQEGLTNVARHAQASQVELKLLRQPEQVTLLICDDGRGFPLPPEGTSGDLHTGLGVVGMQERARLLGGNLVITSQPEQGTAIQASIPLPALAGQRSR
jgi:two-component system sensor histidine kinase UhpB